MSTESIIFTASAVHKVWELIVEEGNPALSLRVFISGGGCSGFQYGFTFDETINEDDFVIEKTVLQEEDEEEGGEGGSTVRLLVDSASFQYLTGAEIDYKKDINGEQFVIRNPQAKTTCGCGSSFSVDPIEEVEEAEAEAKPTNNGAAAALEPADSITPADVTAPDLKEQ